MFEFFFKYPIPVFTKGKFILLGAWPGWLLVLLIVVSAAGLAWLIWRQLPRGGSAGAQLAGVAYLGAGSGGGGPRAAFVVGAGDYCGGTEVAAEHHRGAGGRLAQHEHRGRGHGRTTARETAAVQALSKVLPGLEKKFQTRTYRLDSSLTRIEKPDQWHADAAATHINEGLRQLVAETSDLPVGAVVLLSDGADNPAESIWKRSTRCTIVGCPCTPSDLAKRRPRTTWRWMT